MECVCAGWMSGAWWKGLTAVCCWHGNMIFLLFKKKNNKFPVAWMSHRDKDPASDSTHAAKHLQSWLLKLLVTDSLSDWLTLIICFPWVHVLVELCDCERVLLVKLRSNSCSCLYGLVERCGFVLPCVKLPELAKVWICHEVQISYCVYFLMGQEQRFFTHVQRGFFFVCVWFAWGLSALYLIVILILEL